MPVTIDCGKYDPSNAAVATIKVYELPEGTTGASGYPKQAGWWYEVSIDGHRESAAARGERDAWAKAMAALGRRVAS